MHASTRPPRLPTYTYQCIRRLTNMYVSNTSYAFTFTLIPIYLLVHCPRTLTSNKDGEGSSIGVTHTFGVSIMVEMNQDCTLACLYTDVFTHAVVRQDKVMVGGRPVIPAAAPTARASVHGYLSRHNRE